MTVETTYAIVLTNSDHSDDVAMLFFNDEATRDDYARTVTNEYRNGYFGVSYDNDPADPTDYVIISADVWFESFPIRDTEDYSAA